jgi:outer membrane protein OmpA-like peptidoglycan-associated protein
MFPMIRPWLCGLLLGLLVACVQATSQPDSGRFLVYFDEVSANLTLDARRVVAEAVTRARELKTRSIRIEGRASATGSPAGNQRLAEARSQVVADELARDGLDRATFRQVWIGETGSGDPSVAERRVDIVLER